jgi:DNA-binding response OmpR family regulator
MSEATGRILLVEDHQDIAEMVFAYLERRGFVLDHAADGVTGLHLAVSEDYDLIILDLMLPGMDGLELCAKLRNEAHKDTPVLMLTARDTLADKVAGLDTGADDYLIKPFEIQELEARARALIRRRAGRDLSLTPIGMKMLTILMRASPRVVSRRELERQVWGDVLPDSDTLRSHLYNLRKAIDRPFEHPLLHTVQGAGYRIADENTR